MSAVERRAEARKERARVRGDVAVYREERRHQVARQLAKVRAMLVAAGHANVERSDQAADAHIARLMSVDSTTVFRWRTGAVLPKGERAEGLAVLSRLAWGYLPEKGPLAAARRVEAAKILAFLLEDGWTVRSLRDAVLISSLGWLVPNRSEQT